MEIKCQVCDRGSVLYSGNNKVCRPHIQETLCRRGKNIFLVVSSVNVKFYFRYSETGKTILTEMEIKSIRNIDSEIATMNKNMQSLKPRKNKRRRRKFRSEKRQEESSPIICNMTVHREVSWEGKCTSFGSFCRYDDNKLIYNQVMLSRMTFGFMRKICR